MPLFSRKPSAPPASALRRERRALLLLREERLRELGGLTLEMYRRDRFEERLVLERCAELVAIEARASEINALLAGARGLRRAAPAICGCGAPALIGARFCPSCGRPLAAVATAETVEDDAEEEEPAEALREAPPPARSEAAEGAGKAARR